MMSVCKLYWKEIWRVPGKYQSSRGSSCDQILRIWRPKTPVKYWNKFHVCEKLLGKSRTVRIVKLQFTGHYNGLLNEKINWKGTSTGLTWNILLFGLITHRIYKMYIFIPGTILGVMLYCNLGWPYFMLYSFPHIPLYCTWTKRYTRTRGQLIFFEHFLNLLPLNLSLVFLI